MFVKLSRLALLAVSSLAALAAFVLPVRTVRAAEVPAVTLETVDSNGFFDATGFVLGWHFRAKSNLLVTSLGQFDADGDGLASAAQVAIYALDGTQLVSATVPSGTAAPLDGSFRYVRVAPIVLHAGTEYVIASSCPDTALDLSQGPGSSFTVDPSIALVEDRYTFSNSLVFPTQVDGSVPAWFGPGFQFLPAAVTSISAYYGDDDGFGVGETSGTLSDPNTSHPSPGEAPFTDVQLISNSYAQNGEPAFAPTGGFTFSLPPGAFIVGGSLTLRTGSFVSGPNTLDPPNIVELDGIALDPSFIASFTQTGNQIEEHSVDLPPDILAALADGSASLQGTHLSENSGSGSFQVDFMRLDLLVVTGATTTTSYYGDDDGFGVGETSGTLSDPNTSHPSPGEAPYTDVRLIGDDFIQNNEPPFAPTGGFSFMLPPGEVVVGSRLTLRTGSWVSGPNTLDPPNILELDGIPLDPSFIARFTQTGDLIETHTTALPADVLAQLGDGFASLAGTHLSENSGSGSFQVDFLRLDVVTIPEPREAVLPALAVLALLAARGAQRRSRRSVPEAG